MECEQTSWLGDEEFWRAFAGKIDRLRIPFSGGFDLTRRCNLRCLHCYARGGVRGERPELTTSQWLRLIDEITAAGCLYLLLTGGEPMLREDFSAIYTHAKGNGLLVTVFTNGTLVSDEIIQLFLELPPKAVEVTLYGATPKTHDEITGVSGSFDRCWQGIERMAASGIHVGLKSVLLAPNLKDFAAIEKMAGERGFDFRMDASVFPCLSGEKHPIRLRVAPEAAVEHELADGRRIAAWADFFMRFRMTPASADLYQCGAGISTFHVDSSGYLQPCLMVTGLKYDLLEGSFQEGWSKAMPEIRKKKASAAFACGRCDKRLLCGCCPGFFELENGAEELHSEYLCALARLRLERISEFISGGACEIEAAEDEKKKDLRKA